MQKKERQSSLLNEIIVELTGKCNLACDFCFNKQGIPCKEISKQDIFKILKDIANSGIKSVRFTGGEPFLREDLHEILKKAWESSAFVEPAHMCFGGQYGGRQAPRYTTRR